MFPGHEHLVDPIFEVLGAALSLSSIACQESALHGLGHLQSAHPDRVDHLIDKYLSRGKPTQELKDYAMAASAGVIQ